MVPLLCTVLMKTLLVLGTDYREMEFESRVESYWLWVEPGFGENFSCTDTGLSEDGNIHPGAAMLPSRQDRKGAGAWGPSQSLVPRRSIGFFSSAGFTLVLLMAWEVL